MARVRDHLERAPIVEAVIDFRIKALGDGFLASLEAFAKSIKGYEKKGPIVEFATLWSIEDGSGKARSQSRNMGVRLQSADDKYVLQLQNESFTFSRLEPYQTWETLAEEARRLWQTFVGALQPTAITRVATRFINRLELPMQPDESFEEYLTKAPGVPDELPQGVAGFTQRVVVVNRDLNARANIVQSLHEGFPSPGKVPIVLDIDVYSMVDLPPDSDVAWDLLERLRVFKNAAFYASLTEKAVALYA